MDKDKLRRTFYYEDGVLYWNISKQRIRKYSVARCVSEDGYVLIRLDRKLYRRNRLVWIYHNGNIKDGYVIDHIDGDTSNDDINNLQCITNAENTRKQKLSKANSSGYRGVSFKKDRNKYRASIRYNGKDINLGHYDNAETAALEYDKAAYNYFGKFATLNFPI